MAQRPEVVPQTGHGDAVTAMAWHPARAWLASGDASGIVQVSDITQGVIRLRFASGRRGIFRLAFSPSGDVLYVAGRDGVLRAWAADDGALLWEYPVSRLDMLTGLAASDDAVAVGTTRGRVIVVDPSNGLPLGRWKVGESPGKLGPTVTHGVAWSSDGDTLITAADNGELSAWKRGRWGANKFQYQRRLRAPGPGIFDLALTPDDQLVITGDKAGQVVVRNVTDGTVTATLDSNGYQVARVNYAPGRNEVAVAARHLRVWPLGAEAARLDMDTWSPVSAIAWSKDETQLFTGHVDGSMALWDPESGDLLLQLAGEASRVREIALGPTVDVDVESDAVAFVDDVMAVAGDAGIALWSLREGRLRHRLEGPDEGRPVESALLRRSEDGTVVLAGAGDGGLYAWRADNGELIDTSQLEASVRDIAADDNNLYAATDRFIEWTDANGARRRWATGEAEVRSISPCGPDGSLLVHGERGFRYRNPETGARLTRLRYGGQRIVCAPDGSQFAVGRVDGSVHIYNANTVKRTRRLKRSILSTLGDFAGTAVGDNRITDLAYHPTQPWLLTASLGSPAKVWNLENGTIRLQLDAFGVTAVAFGPGQTVITGSSDGTLRFWDLDTGALLATAVALGSEWLAWTPDGLFDGSQQGQRTLFRWRIGDTLHPPSRFQRGFYEPGLVGALMAGRRPRAQRDIANLAPPPRVTITSPRSGAKVSEGTVTVDVAIADVGGGASDPRLYLNGHRVASSLGRGLDVSGEATEDGEIVRFRVDLIEGRNHLRATAFNGDGNWEALGDEVVIHWEAPVTEPPKLYVLAVGIDAYRNARLDLNFARDDAEAIADFFDVGLFGDIVTTVLVDDDASLTQIRESFERVAAEAAPRDALLVYMAGHGVMEGEAFFFLPWDADVQDTDTITGSGFSQNELGELLARIPATKQLVVLDACHSGAASSALATLVSRRSSPGLVRAQQRLAHSTGAFLIAASTEAQVAHEIPELGHGVLTYAILKGLGEEGPPEAHVDRDGNVTVNTLIQYVSELVPELSDRYHQQRQEVVQAADGQDFPLVSP